MPKIDSLDSLLGDDEPNATFHDAVLSSLQIDYVSKRFTGDMCLCVGDASAGNHDDRERRRTGCLMVEDLSVWALEPPGANGSVSSDGLWLTTDGRLAQAPTEAGQQLARSLKPGEAGWFLFFSNLNAFAYLVGRRFEFHWS